MAPRQEDMTRMRHELQAARRRLVHWAQGDILTATAVVAVPRRTWLLWRDALRARPRGGVWVPAEARP